MLLRTVPDLKDDIHGRCRKMTFLHVCAYSRMRPCSWLRPLVQRPRHAGLVNIKPFCQLLLRDFLLAQQPFYVRIACYYCILNA